MIMDANQIVYDIDRIINEIRVLLDNRCYLSALTSALILPDLCSDIERKREPKSYHYKENKLNNHQKYAIWCNRWIRYLRPPQPLVTSEGTCGDILYKLRCGILHNAKVDVCGKSYLLFDLRGFSFFARKDKSFGKDYVSFIRRKIVTTGMTKHKLIDDEMQRHIKGHVNPCNKVEIKIYIDLLVTSIIDATVRFMKFYKLTAQELPQLKIDLI